MTTSDLSKNRDRIIRKINYQTNEAGAIRGVMTKMVKWLETREDIQTMTPTMKNIDKFTFMCINSWLKNDATLTVTQEWLEKRELAKFESISF